MKKRVVNGVVFVLTMLAVSAVFAADPTTTGGAGANTGLAKIATNILGSLGGIAQLITAGAYVSGMAFVVGSIVKFKAHKDNPTQIPIGTPIAMLFVGAALLFAPSLFQAAGTTIFGEGAQTGGISGITDFTTKK